MNDKFTAWVRSGIVVGLLPVFVNIVAILFTPLSWSLWTLIGRGELLMLSLGLSVGAVLDMPSVGMRETIRDRHSLMCISCIIGAAITYTGMVFARAYGDSPNEVVVSVVSLIVYGPSVYASARCVATVERRD